MASTASMVKVLGRKAEDEWNMPALRYPGQGRAHRETE